MARINALYWFVSSLSKGDRRRATTMPLIRYCLSCDLYCLSHAAVRVETFRESFAELPIAIIIIFIIILLVNARRLSGLMSNDDCGGYV